jgi:hypothetical protein
VTGEGRFCYKSFRLPKFKYQYHTGTTSKSTSCAHNTPSDNKVANPYLPCAFIRFHSSVAGGFLPAPSQNPECSPRRHLLTFPVFSDRLHKICTRPYLRSALLLFPASFSQKIGIALSY